MDFPSEIFVIPAIFIGMPWIIFHYITKWKVAATITTEDENLLDDLYRMARRLDERMETIERIIAADNPDWRPTRLDHPVEQPSATLDKFDKLINERR